MKMYVVVAITLILGLVISLEAGLYIVYQTVKERHEPILHQICHEWDRKNHTLVVVGTEKTYYDTVGRIGVQNRTVLCK